MARYIKESISREEVRPVLLLRAMASELLDEQKIRHLAEEAACPCNGERQTYEHSYSQVEQDSQWAQLVQQLTDL